MTYTAHPYRPGEDLATIVSIVQEAWLPQRRACAYFHVGDLYWRMREESFEQQLWLWKDADGHTVGFCAWNAGDLEIQIRPYLDRVDLLTTVLAWAEAQARSVTAYTMDVDTTAQSVLTSRGYRQQSHSTDFHRRALNELPASPAMPPGYIVRYLRGEEELDERVAAHQAGWESRRMLQVNYRRLMAMPGYRAELDIVVEAPDGSLVASCNCWLDEASKTGLFEPLSVAPEHRRKGLGRALIHKGLQQLRAFSAREAWVGSRPGSPATKLYESCGMQVTLRESKWAQLD